MFKQSIRITIREISVIIKEIIILIPTEIIITNTTITKKMISILMNMKKAMSLMTIIKKVPIKKNIIILMNMRIITIKAIRKAIENMKIIQLTNKTSLILLGNISLIFIKKMKTLSIRNMEIVTISLLKKVNTEIIKLKKISRSLRVQIIMIFLILQKKKKT
jgi:hypothetical protein